MTEGQPEQRTSGATPEEVFRVQLRRHREARGWTQETLGEKSGLGRQTVARLEATERPTRRGTESRVRNVRLDEALALAAALRIPPAALWVPLWTDVEGLTLESGDALTPGEALAWTSGRHPVLNRSPRSTGAAVSVATPESVALAAYARAAWTADELSHQIETDRRFQDDPGGDEATAYLRDSFASALDELMSELEILAGADAVPPPLHPAVARALQHHREGIGFHGIAISRSDPRTQEQPR
jgi:transcriptional regulator with XRE-family HTH domain